MVPIGDTAPNPYFVLDSCSRCLTESQIWQCCPPASFWKRISKCLVMKYCHASNLASFSKQAILFHGLHNSASIAMVSAAVSPLPTHFLVKGCVQSAGQEWTTLAQVAKRRDKVLLTQLCYFIILVAVRVCPGHL